MKAGFFLWGWRVGGEPGFQGLTGDGVTGAAAGAGDLEGGLLAEEGGGVGAHRGGKEGAHAVLGAAAGPAEGTGFQGTQFFGGIKGCHRGGIDHFKPGEVAVGLGGEEGEFLLIQAEEAGGALLALAVEGFNGVEYVGALERRDAAAGFGVAGDVVGEEEVFREAFDVFGEGLAGEGAEFVVGGGEEVEQGIFKMKGPGEGFIPGAGGGVEGEGGEEVFEEAVRGFGETEAVVGEVEVVIDVEG